MKQNAMQERKFEGILWRNAGNVFKATKDVQRKPFGDFTVRFDMNANTGETKMCVSCWQFEQLDSKTETYATFKQAVHAAIAYFDRIDELVQGLPLSAKIQAEKAYKQVLVREIEKQTKENAKHGI